MTVAITDVVLRDAHQSLFATRLRLDDMLPVAAQLDDVGYRSLECWGGATFDACIRFLGEDPWVRLRELKKAMPKTPLQMLLRGQNCSATATTPTTWWSASWSAPSKTAWTSSASSMP
ncbi:oxaloacetate decarboxylase [Klebsiella pneumoniae]|nr:oxaloacetate decarboxylase [Klebsiella pneumoniae]